MDDYYHVEPEGDIDARSFQFPSASHHWVSDIPPIDSYESAAVEADTGTDIDSHDAIFSPGLISPENPFDKQVEKVHSKNPKSKPVAPAVNMHSLDMIEPLIELPESVADTIIGRLATQMASLVQFPLFSTFTTLLVGAGCSVSTAYSAAFSVKGGPLNAGMYALIEQPPSTGKSRILDRSIEPYQVGIKKFNKRVAGKNRETLERLQDNPPPPMPFASQAYNNVTAAGLDGMIANYIDGRFVLVSAEKGLLTNMFPQSATFSSDNDLALKGWPGEMAASARVSRKSFVGDVAGSLCIVAQPGAALRILNESEGSGLSERFMFVSEPDLLGQRAHEVDQDESILDPWMEPYRRGCLEAVRIYSDMAIERWIKGDYERISFKDLIRIAPGKEAAQLICDIKNRVEPELAERRSAGDMVGLGWVGKIDAHILKVATTMHVIECLGNGSKVPTQMPLKIVQAAADFIMVMKDHLQEIMTVNGQSGGGAESETILTVLERRGLSMRQVVMAAKNRAPFKSRGKDAYRAAKERVEKMIDNGEVIITKDGKLEAV